MSENKNDNRNISGSIEHHENNDEMLRRYEDTFTGFIGRSWDGILLAGDSGSIIEWNPALETITGLKRSETMGKKLWDVYFSLLPLEKRTPELLENLKTTIISALKTGQPAELGCSTEHEIQCPDHQIRVLESFMFTIPAGNTFLAAAILRNITDRKYSEQSLQESNRKLNLLSSITRHDINNQLTIFNGYLALLEAGTPALSSGDIIRILQGATAKIQRILKFTRDYQDIGVKSPAWQDLGETIRSAKSTVEVTNIRFLYGELCKGVEVYADPMLVRVFSNLIDNSLSHGEKVSEIQVHCTPEEHRLVIVYKDDGVGISNKIRPVLYERGKGKNTGYGLFLIREILSITGFTITETGEPGTGARFEIIVPEGYFRLTDKKEEP